MLPQWSKTKPINLLHEIIVYVNESQATDGEELEFSRLSAYSKLVSLNNVCYSTFTTSFKWKCTNYLQF